MRHKTFVLGLGALALFGTSSAASNPPWLDSLLALSPSVTLPLRLKPDSWRSDPLQPFSFMRCEKASREFPGCPSGRILKFWGKFSLPSGNSLITMLLPPSPKTEEEASEVVYSLYTFDSKGTLKQYIVLSKYHLENKRLEFGLFNISSDYLLEIHQGTLDVPSGEHWDVNKGCFQIMPDGDIAPTTCE